MPIPPVVKPQIPTINRPVKPGAIPEFRIQQPMPKKQKKGGGVWKKLLLFLGGIILVLIMAGAGGWLGYLQAVSERVQEQDEAKIGAAVTQYQLGVVDMQAGRLEVARQRFEYVIRIDPTFPEATSKLTEVMMMMTTVTVPTEVLTPTVEPTPDNRNIEEKYASALNLYAAQDWDGAIDTLMSVRKDDIAFNAVQMDSMLYVALRQRGIRKIGSGSLEPGIYDLALAEKFAPIDHDAENSRVSARQYIIGASFWGFDWAQVYSYFQDIAKGNGGMVDSTGKTASYRYAYAAAKLGDAAYAKPDYCLARDYYSEAGQSGINGLAATATKAAYDCNPPTEAVSLTPTTAGGTTATLTATGGGSTVAATATTAVVATTVVPVTTTEVPAATTDPGTGTTPEGTGGG